MTPDGGPAFPFVEVRSVNKLTGSPLSQVIHEGMSKRDEFAKAAMQTLASRFIEDLHWPARPDERAATTTRFLPLDEFEDDEFDDLARLAYTLADAMLRARALKQEAGE